MVVKLLPVQTTPFIGSVEELAEIYTLLTNPDCRLLTLVGPGGIGKTRLAIQAAVQVSEGFADGVYFVALQPVSRADYLLSTLAEAVRFSFSEQQDPRQQLLSYLSAKSMLLVMDNFEHLIEAADLLPAILQIAPRIKILVTSRVVLDLQEEWIRSVQGLNYPEEGLTQHIEAYSAAQLFIERARRVRANFSPDQDRESIARICRLVEGMPLALELAATWLKTLGCSEIAAEIQRNLDFLSTTLRNLPERHRSMRAVFEQSWNLLELPEREAFKCLAVFQGSFQHQAAQAVTGGNLLTIQALMDRSLLRMAPNGRYEIHELLKQYAAERLGENPQEEEQAYERHCDYYTEYLSRQERRLTGPDQLSAATDIDAEIDNIRSAWRWAVEKGKADAIERSSGCLLIYNQMRTRHHEAAEMFNLAAQQFEAMGGELTGNLDVHAAWFEAGRANYEKAIALYKKGLSYLRDVSLQGSAAMALAGIAFIYSPDDQVSSEAEFTPIFLAYFEDARAKAERRSEAWLTYALGAFASRVHRSEGALEWLRGSLEIFKAQGDRWGSTYVLHLMGEIYIQLQAYPEAWQIFQETLSICQEVRDQGGVAFSLGKLGIIATLQKKYESSRYFMVKALKLMLETKRDPFVIGWQLFELAGSFYQAGENVLAAQLGAYILSNPAFQDTDTYLKPHMDELKAIMTPEDYTKAVKAGESMDLEGLMQELWEEYKRSEEIAEEGQDLFGKPSTGRQALIEPLSSRELEVLTLIAAGLSNQEIARKLVVTVGTVKKHINNIFGKMQVSSRTQATARARELGIL